MVFCFLVVETLKKSHGLTIIPLLVVASPQRHPFSSHHCQAWCSQSSFSSHWWWGSLLGSALPTCYWELLVLAGGSFSRVRHTLLTLRTPTITRYHCGSFKKCIQAV